MRTLSLCSDTEKLFVERFSGSTQAVNEGAPAETVLARCEENSRAALLMYEAQSRYVLQCDNPFFADLPLGRSTAHQARPFV